jgi:hypothetical protein
MRATEKVVLAGMLSAAMLSGACKRSDRYEQDRYRNPPRSPTMDTTSSQERGGTVTPTNPSGTGGSGSSNIGNTNIGGHVSSDSDITNGPGTGIGAAGNAGVIEGRGPDADKKPKDGGTGTNPGGNPPQR